MLIQWTPSEASLLFRNNPKKPGNLCYNIQFAFRGELKAYITGLARSGNTYTANGSAEMIKEIQRLPLKSPR